MGTLLKNKMLAKVTGFGVGSHGETTTLGLTAPAQPSVLVLPHGWGHLCPHFSETAGPRNV